MGYTQKKSKKGAVVLLLLVVAVAVTAIIFSIPHKEASAIMECDVNPNVQFILNDQNKVLAVNCLNSDAQILVSGQDFVNKTVEVAAEMFVDISTKAGFIDVNTTGTSVSFVISCEEPEKLSYLETNIKNKVNAYFDSNGIIAGAVVEVNNEFNTVVEKAGIFSTRHEGLSNEQILIKVLEMAKLNKDVAFTFYADFHAQFCSLRTLNYSNLDTLLEGIDAARENIENNARTRNQVDYYQSQIEEKQEEYDTLYKAYEAEVAALHEQLKAQSVTLLAEAKLTLETKISDNSTQIENHKREFNQNRNEINAAINTYRATLID